ncbi:sensor histidine kinase [Luteimonas viscosa]|uniref:Sensor histidine kinase n=1 Tax=Luteimonas viscosa TaxID=1132694 RepID=A0A5D4XTK1_9GAMM|nr:sensor histidine kinase [Luteimonas viscosa]TYT27325.1 sensor histidine kinase [Luteimonas viscosa]
MRDRPWPMLPIVTAWWTLYGVASTSQWLSMEGADGEVMPLREAATLGFASAWLWIPMTMLLLWCVRRFPIERGKAWRSTLATLAMVLLLVLLRAAAVIVLNPWVGWYHAPPPYDEVLLASLGNNFLLLWLMVGAAHALLYAARARQRERQAEQLQAALVEARLQALASQLNPHFMFNALNSIAEMVHHDPDAADRMLVALGELLRSSLDHQARPLVPLHEELALLRHYLDLEKMRLGERLRVDWAIEPRLDELPVPPLALQPLAENAIVHALSLRISPGRLSVQARADEDALEIAIADDGGHRESTVHHGNGLANLHARLRHLYGEGEWLRLEANDRGGTTARLRMPRRAGSTGVAA